jgi:DNA-binding NtrC family response regulator
MTAHGSIDSVKEALRGGAFDYLEKPLDRDQLLARCQPRHLPAEGGR